MLLRLLTEDPVLYVLLVVVTIGSIVLHELGHAITATWQGDLTPRIRGHLTWNPVVHMGWTSLILAATFGLAWGQTPVNPNAFRDRRWGDVMVSFAGPAVHLLLAGAACLSLHMMPPFRESDPASAAYWIALFWEIVLWRNCALFILNMIPVPPLDGFTVAKGFIHFGELGWQLERAHPIPMVVVLVLVWNGIIPLVPLVTSVTHALGGTLLP